MNPIWNFCHSTCHAACCKRGKLNLKEAELELVVGRRRAQLEREGRLAKEWDGSWTLVLAPQCPALGAEWRCAIYEQRPRACREYPLFTFRKDVVMVEACPLVRNGLLEPHLDHLRKDGSRII